MDFSDSAHQPLAAQDSEDNAELKLSNLFYICIFVLFAIICFLFYNTGSAWIGKIIKTVLKGKYEIGSTLVARTTSALAIWFLVHAVLTLGNRNFEDSIQFLIHSKFKYIHFLICVALWIAFWFIPDGFFNFYMKFAMVISLIYIIFQIYFLVIFFTDLNEKHASDDNLCCLFSITIVLCIVSIVGFALSYWMFKENKDQTIAFTTVNLIISIILFVMSIFIEHGSIFTSSLVTTYIAFLTWSALMCERSSTSSKGIEIVFTIIASIFTLVWCGYSAFASSSQLDDCQCSDSDSDCVCCDTTHYPKFSLSFFHTLFALASVYVTMIVTHWGKTESEAPWTTSRGNIAKWVNIVSSWIVALLYFWILIAPLVCKNRDFS